MIRVVGGRQVAWPVGSAYQRQYGNRPWVPTPVLVRPALGTVAR